jgi:ADP-dependent NAD(P)H-hydrate dehydratase / NAD(P)H-hydrate epimerase
MRNATILGKTEPIYLTAQIRLIEQAAVEDSPRIQLMERAGEAAADIARALLSENATSVLVLAGPGNNGGDAYVVARHLKRWWYHVDVVSIGDPKKLVGEAANACAMWQEAGGTIDEIIPTDKRYDLVIDGLLGIGLTREISGSYRNLIEQVIERDIPVLALDIPSGLDSDTGMVRGIALPARDTVTFIALKPGLLTRDGPDYCGNVHIADLGLKVEEYVGADGRLLRDVTIKHLLLPRKKNSHKGQFGDVGVIGGADGMVGAALLAARAALKLGAGRVFVGLIAKQAPVVDPLNAELMLREAEEILSLANLGALIVGPGLGKSVAAKRLLIRAMETDWPLLIDADGLTWIAAEPDLQLALHNREATTIITPHPAEAARLLGTMTGNVQNDRLAAARELVNQLQSHVVLKGVGSICITRDGKWHINTSGNPGLSSGGMGDALAGMIAALMAQGLSPEHAMLYGVYLHGAAADHCVANDIGPVGLTASEVIDAARRVINTWISPSSQ